MAEGPAFAPAGTSGTEHITREDTKDADYGRLLERAERRLTGGNGKGVARPEGFTPFPSAGPSGRQPEAPVAGRSLDGDPHAQDAQAWVTRTRSG